MKLKYKAYYGYAWDHFRSAWPRILVWTGFWFLIPALFVVFSYKFVLDTYASAVFGGGDGGGILASFFSLGTVSLFLINFVFEAIRNYSLFGIPYQTAEDPEGPWLQTGLQGVFHPLRALGISVAIQLITWLYIGILFFVTINVMWLGGVVWALLIIGISLVYLYFISGYATAWFQRFEDESLSGFGALKASLEYMRGKRIMIILVLLPVLLAFVLCSRGCLGAFTATYEPVIAELDMAAYAQKQIAANRSKDEASMRQAELGALTPRERERVRKMMEREIFSRPVPENQGDIHEYIHELAEYGLAREEFEASRDQRALVPVAQAYADRAYSTGRWWLAVFGLGFLDIFLLGFALVLFFQVYREMQSSLLDSITQKDKTDEPAKPELLRSKPEPSAPTAIDPLAPPDAPEPLQPEPEAADEPKYETKPQARPESIDPGFTLKF